MHLSAILLTLALAGCLYTLAACGILARSRHRRAEVGGSAPWDGAWPTITVLKPLHGDEPHLYSNLASFLRQDYPAPVEVIFGVGEGTDPAVPTAERLRADFPDQDIRLVADPRRRGRNGKVSNLINMAEHARHELIVLADSDMLVGPGYLRRLAEEVGKPGVGAVTCFYRGLALPNLWSKLAARWIDWQFLPNVVVGVSLGLAKPCFGSTVALRRDTLDRIGGFAAVKDQLADDYAIGAAVRGLGLRVALPPDLVLGHLCAANSLRDLARQELRWARTIRSLDPVGFLGSVITQPVPLATLAVLACRFSTLSWAVLGGAVASRLLLQLFVARFARTPPEGLILGPLRDYATFLIFVVSLWPGSIDWRGHRFALKTDGTLAPPKITGS